MTARKRASVKQSREEHISALTDQLHRYLHWLEDELDELWLDLKPPLNPGISGEGDS